jgi:APA family basic amino acid/polyamine antiporter
VLRRTRPDQPRPVKAPFYPWLQIVYVVLAAAVVINLLIMKPVNAGWGLLIILSGLPVYFFWRSRAAPSPSRK